MQIIQQDNVYTIFEGDVINSLTNLPTGTYRINFNSKTGYSLSKIKDLEVKTKVYGDQQEKSNKVMKSFNKSNKNFGIMLSGAKGIGKSLFARVLAEKCISNNIPVILVTQSTPGLPDFIQSIDQEVMVLFDEFDKVFPQDEDGDSDEELPTTQDMLLPVFDGTSRGKKLFVITLNKTYLISEYLLNRPGRFHYHFKFNYPEEKELSEFLKDKLDKQYWDQIPEVALFSKRIRLNFDCLTAIAFELNMGGDFKDIINDLNIDQENNEMLYNVEVHLSNNKVIPFHGLKDHGWNSCDLSGNPIALDLTFATNDVPLTKEAKDSLDGDSEFSMVLNAPLNSLHEKEGDLIINVKDLTTTNRYMSDNLKDILSFIKIEPYQKYNKMAF